MAVGCIIYTISSFFCSYSSFIPVVLLRCTSEIFCSWKTVFHVTNCSLYFHVLSKQLRQRPPHLLKRRPFSETSSASGTPYWNVSHPLATDPFKPAVRVAHTVPDFDAVFACLIEVEGSDTNVCTGNVFPLPVHKGQVGSLFLYDSSLL